MQARDAPLMSDPAASATGREVKATAVGAETIDADAGTPVSVSPQPDAVLTQQRDAVKNAFAVKQSAKPTKRNAIALGIVAVLLLLTSAGGWYVWTEMNRLARPQAAKPSPPTVLAAASAPATAPTATAPQSAGGAPVTPNSATGATTGAPSVDSAGFDATLSPASVPTAALPPLLPPPAIEIATPKALAASKAAAPTPREAVARQAEALPAALAPAQKVQLKPATGSALIDPALAAGYAALTAGDYASAKRHYADVLAASTNNIDAHLGMATALARSTTAEDTRSAKRYYARVLELDPRNGTAMAGLIALSSDMRADTMTAPADRARFEQREAELSRLVTADPQSATAHYMLGNHYAAARRWTEAQSSYFEAARLAPDNADFAYNLAVSLDHLGQARNALLFYQRALAARTRGTFDRKVVEARVSAISAQPLDAAAPARGVQ
jgi:cytochrome c-type biogenesis protein CcmH/NrfG